MTPEQFEMEAIRWRRSMLVAGVGALAAGAALSFWATKRAIPIGQTLSIVLLLAAAGYLAISLLLTTRRGSPDRRATLAGWPQALTAGGLSTAALWLGYRVIETASATPPIAWWLPGAGVLAVAAFPVLVLERHLAVAGAGLPEAAGLGRLSRFLIAGLILAAGLLILGGLGAPETAGRAIQTTAAIAGLLAIEQLARAGALFFLPTPRAIDARALGDGMGLRLLFGPWRGEAGVRAAIEARLGIDLSRSWAIGFARRASAPIGLALGLFAWALTGVATIPADERGIHEAFGAPVAVFGPGLHIGLPWPAGRVRRVEFGTVHRLSIALGDKPDLEPLIPAEARPPASADRLWDAGHPSEASYLIPGVAGTRPSFQAVNLDIRLVYRIALDDHSALAARYQVSQPEAMLRALAGQRLLRYFSTRTLQGLLIEDPRRLGDDVRLGLQADLDAAKAGIELMAVVVESIHPPPGAAAAYHSVQAAEIRAAGEVAAQRQRATNTVGEARQVVTETLNVARATAASTLNAAEIERLQFDADLKAVKGAPDSMLLERRLAAVERGFANAKLLIIDRHIDAEAAGTLDLRTLPGPGEAD